MLGRMVTVHLILKNHLFIWLCWILVTAWGNLVLLTRDGTLACTGNAESQPLDHQASPYI